MPTATATQVAAWKRPSQSVFVSNPADGRCRVVALVAEHVVPLQDLMQDDPIDKPAQTDAEQDPGSPRASDCDIGFVRDRPQRAAGSACAFHTPALLPEALSASG